MGRKSDDWIEKHGTVRDRIAKDIRQGKEPTVRGTDKCPDCRRSPWHNVGWCKR